MGFDKTTVDTYDRSAKQLAEYFKGYGTRIPDVELAFKLAGEPAAARVVEIGCGDGRDAEAIIPKAAWYEGFDPSEALLSLARQRNPGASFVTDDAISYSYPENLDIVFAFASLLHVSRDELKQVLEKLHACLKTDGIVFLSLKERPEYDSEMKHDEFGDRLFYYYNVQTVVELAGTSFKSVYEDRQKIGKTDWFTLALQKN